MSFLVTFPSVSAALLLQNLLGAQATPCRIIPVPRALSSSCGYAALVERLPLEALARLMEAEEIEWEAVYQSQPVDGRYECLAAYESE